MAQLQYSKGIDIESHICMKTINKLLVLFALISVQNLVIFQRSLANTCNEVFSPGELSQNDEQASRWLTFKEGAKNVFTALTGVELGAPKKISVLKGLGSFAPEGWDLKLATQSLPVEIIRYQYSYTYISNDIYVKGVRVWVDSDLGNANVNLYRSGDIEISLSSAMNSATAQRVLSYQEILNRVKESSLQTAADIEALMSAGALEIRRDGISIWKKDSDFIVSRKLKAAAQRLTQAIVDFLQQDHLDIPVNPKKNSYYSNKLLAHKEIANYIQSELSVMPPPETKDVYRTSKDLLEPQENRPSFYSHYVVQAKGIGKVRMLLGNGDYSPTGFKWVMFEATRKGDTLPSEKKIREILGAEVAPYIEDISTYSNGSIQINFSEYRGNVAWQMVSRLVTALKNGSLVNSSTP